MFREHAVESVAAPESINVVAPIASPRLWLVFAGIATMVLAFAGWGFLGSIPLIVRGTGILIEGSMVVAAEAPIEGRLVEIRVKAGDAVAQGDVLAVVASPAAEVQLSDARATVTRLREQHGSMVSVEDGVLAAANRALDAREDECRGRVAFAEAAYSEFGRSIESRRDMVRQGLLAEADLLASINTQLEIGRGLSDARAELQRIQAERAEAGARHRLERQRRENSIAEAESEVRQLEAALAADRHVIAPRPGKVLQVMRTTGDLVRRGSSVAVISDAGDGRMRCYAFFPLAEGKRTQQGMDAQVEPSIADRERFGVIKGSVRDVEPVTGTRESLMRIINSPEVAQDIERKYGGIVSAVIDLEQDPASPSGLRWTGGSGYPRTLTPGTLCDVDVVTEKVPPVALLLPWFKQVLGG
jgi:NHLM bacteriocin system secretion protein